jgi:hypothetical protein
MSERHAGGPRGGLNFSYHPRPGWVLYSLRKDRNGKVMEAKYRPPEKLEPAEPRSSRRGAVAVELQGKLI